MRCGNFKRSARDTETWINATSEGVLCPDCGARTAALVRGSDLYPTLKVRAHDAPEGVTPAPYAAHAQGAVHPIPAIGDTSEGKGELAGGDVQALPRSHRPRTSKGNRHAQRTPLPGDPDFVRPSLSADVLRGMLGKH